MNTLKHTTSARLLTQGVYVAYRKKRRFPYPMRDIVHQGRIGFKKNKNNPFPLTSDRYREWLRGYNLAYYENIKYLQEDNHAT